VWRFDAPEEHFERHAGKWFAWTVSDAQSTFVRKPATRGRLMSRAGNLIMNLREPQLAR
jgi:hypothetical protein